MQRNTLNFIIDLLATLALLVMIASGLLLYFVLPPGSRGGRGLQFWELDRHQWGDVHFWAALTLIALMVLHVVLHWNWVCATVYRWVNPQGFREKRMTGRKQNLYGGAFLVVVVALVGGFLWVAAANVTRGGAGHDYGPGGYRGGRGATAEPAAVEDSTVTTREARAPGHQGLGPGGQQIRGSTTLRGAAELAGLSVEQLATELGLPADVSPDERLGHLRQTYGFQMSDVRRIVAEHAGARDAAP